jgi:hypothetical protein
MRTAGVRLLWAALAAALLLNGGCSSKNKGKLEGTKWTSLPGVVKGNNLAAGALGLEFGKDGSLVYKTPQGEFKGTYSLGMGESVTLHLDRPLSNGKVHNERITVDGDKLTMKDPDGTELSFSRVK